MIDNCEKSYISVSVQRTRPSLHWLVWKALTKQHDCKNMSIRRMKLISGMGYKIKRKEFDSFLQEMVDFCFVEIILKRPRRIRVIL